MKIKKKNLFLVLICVILLSLILIYRELQPIFKIKTNAYFHEKVVQEIMKATQMIEIPQDFIVNYENQMSINTQLLNQWIIQVNDTLHQVIQDQYTASIPLGYFTGNVYFQSMGPSLNYDFLIENQIKSTYDIKSTTLGINNVLIELILKVECTGILLIGIEKSEMIIRQEIPLALRYIQGEVPQFFPY